MEISKSLLLIPLFVSVCFSYGKIPYAHKQYNYVPAPPGHTPSCATAGSTYCESAHGYPKDVIGNLLRSVKLEDILKDETQIEFKFNKPEPKKSSYGPHNVPSGHLGYGYHRNGKKPDNYKNKGQWNSDSSSSEIKNPFYSNQNSYNKGNGYDSSSYYQPSFSDQKYANYHHRVPRKTPFDNPEAKKRSKREEFVQSISPRSKRQISANREQLCEIRTNYINPQAGLNSQGNWMYIVNGEASTQLVRTETCASEECSNLCQLPNGYNSRCEQKFVQKRLVALDGNGDKLYTDTFWIPSCCVCTLSNST